MRVIILCFFSLFLQNSLQAEGLSILSIGGESEASKNVEVFYYSDKRKISIRMPNSENTIVEKFFSVEDPDKVDDTIVDIDPILREYEIPAKDRIIIKSSIENLKYLNSVTCHVLHLKVTPLGDSLNSLDELIGHTRGMINAVRSEYGYGIKMEDGKIYDLRLVYDKDGKIIDLSILKDNGSKIMKGYSIRSEGELIKVFDNKNNLLFMLMPYFNGNGDLERISIHKKKDKGIKNYSTIHLAFEKKSRNSKLVDTKVIFDPENVSSSVSVDSVPLNETIMSQTAVIPVNDGQYFKKIEDRQIQSSLNKMMPFGVVVNDSQVDAFRNSYNKCMSESISLKGAGILEVKDDVLENNCSIFGVIEVSRSIFRSNYGENGNNHRKDYFSCLKEKGIFNVVEGINILDTAQLQDNESKIKDCIEGIYIEYEKDYVRESIMSHESIKSIKDRHMLDYIESSVDKFTRTCIDSKRREGVKICRSYTDIIINSILFKGKVAYRLAGKKGNELAALGGKVVENYDECLSFNGKDNYNVREVKRKQASCLSESYINFENKLDESFVDSKIKEVKFLKNNISNIITDDIRKKINDKKYTCLEDELLSIKNGLRIIEEFDTIKYECELGVFEMTIPYLTDEILQDRFSKEYSEEFSKGEGEAIMNSTLSSVKSRLEDELGEAQIFDDIKKIMEKEEYNFYAEIVLQKIYPILGIDLSQDIEGILTDLGISEEEQVKIFEQLDYLNDEEYAEFINNWLKRLLIGHPYLERIKQILKNERNISDDITLREAISRWIEEEAVKGREGENRLKTIADNILSAISTMMMRDEETRKDGVAPFFMAELFRNLKDGGENDVEYKGCLNEMKSEDNEKKSCTYEKLAKIRKKTVSFEMNRLISRGLTEKLSKKIKASSLMNDLDNCIKTAESRLEKNNDNPNVEEKSKYIEACASLTHISYLMTMSFLKIDDVEDSIKSTRNVIPPPVTFSSAAGPRDRITKWASINHNCYLHLFDNKNNSNSDNAEIRQYLYDSISKRDENLNSIPLLKSLDEKSTGLKLLELAMDANFVDDLFGRVSYCTRKIENRTMRKIGEHARYAFMEQYNKSKKKEKGESWDHIIKKISKSDGFRRTVSLFLQANELRKKSPTTSGAGDKPDVNSNLTAGNVNMSSLEDFMSRLAPLYQKGENFDKREMETGVKMLEMQLNASFSTYINAYKNTGLSSEKDMFDFFKSVNLADTISKAILADMVKESLLNLIDEENGSYKNKKIKLIEDLTSAFDFKGLFNSKEGKRILNMVKKTYVFSHLKGAPVSKLNDRIRREMGKIITKNMSPGSFVDNYAKIAAMEALGGDISFEKDFDSEKLKYAIEYYAETIIEGGIRDPDNVLVRQEHILNEFKSMLNDAK